MTLAQAYDVALLDLDGVVYVGTDAVEHAPASLEAARSAGMRMAFVTNNAARPASAVAAHLRELGVAADEREVITSAQAAARVLADRFPAGASILVVGGEGLVSALAERGLRAVESMDGEPVAVVQGFHPDVGWRLLAEGTYAVASGLPWVATNTDLTIPTARGLAPGNGTLVDAVRAATGREPLVAGKPEPPMHREAVLRTGAARPLVVGDRLDTDIEGAVNAGVDSLLVLTGVTDPLDLVLAPPRHRPTYVGADLRALLADPVELVPASTGASASGWHVQLDGDDLTVRSDSARQPRENPGERFDATAMAGLRAVCAAVWASPVPFEAGTVRSALAGVPGLMPG